MREDRRELLRVRDGVRKARNEFKKRALTSVRSLKVKRSGRAPAPPARAAANAKPVW